MNHEIICPACCHVHDAKGAAAARKLEREIAAYARLKTGPLEKERRRLARECRRLTQEASFALRTAAVLAARLQDATAAEDSKHYDRSRTFCDRQDDYEFATAILRQLNPKLRAVERRLKTP